MNIIFSTILTLGILLTGWNTMSMDDLEYLNANNWLNSGRLGAFTELASTNQLNAFPTTYNANLAKTIEVGTTTVNSITSLPGLTTASALATVGTITTGVWNGTAIPVGYGGTGTTSPSRYFVMLGNAANGLTHASSTGTAGQLFASNGAFAYPSWQSPAVDIAITYAWTAQHTFNGANLGIGTTSPTTKLSVVGNAFLTGTTTTGNLNVASGTAQLNGLQANFPSSQTTGSGSATTSELLNDGTGNWSWQIPFVFGATSTNPGFIGEQVINHALGRVPRMITMNMNTVVDLGGVDQSATSVGYATSSIRTVGGAFPAQNVLSMTRGDSAMINTATNVALIEASDTGGTGSVLAGISDWTATTFTIYWDTNALGGVEAARKMIYKIE